MSTIRIFVNEEIGIGNEIIITDNIFHYLSNVMRVRVEDKINIINGLDGEFLSVILKINKKNLTLKVINKVKDVQYRKFLGLIFAPIQKIDILLKGATELGATAFFPIITEYTNKKNLKLNKIQSNVIEAIEQCERTDLPIINSMQSLSNTLKELDKKENIIFFCEERTSGNQILNLYKNLKNTITNKNIYALIGPEGGFSTEEKKLINSYKNVISINLGDTILRSETAAVSILSILKAFFYD